MGVLFLGIETATRENWAKIFNPCKATRSKLPESIAREIEEKAAARIAEAATTPFLARVTAGTIIDRDGQSLFTARGEKAAFDILRYLETETVFAAKVEPRHTCLFCFDARNTMRIIATDAVSRGPIQGLTKTFDFWLRPTFVTVPAPWVDPCDAFITSSLQHDIGLGGLCKFLGIDHQLGDDLPAGDAARAALVREIALKGHLI